MLSVSETGKRALNLIKIRWVTKVHGVEFLKLSTHVVMAATSIIMLTPWFSLLVFVMST